MKEGDINLRKVGSRKQAQVNILINKHKKPLLANIV
jgi:hypothetical protein